MKQNNVFKTGMLVAMSALVLMACDSNEPKESKEVAEVVNDQNIDGRSAEKDAQFLVDAVSNSYDEVLIADLALTRSTNANIKTMAQQIKDEHTILLGELKTVADSKAVSLPTTASENAVKEVATLTEKKATDFDKAWLEEVEDLHDNSVKKFENAADDAMDATIKTWASTNLVKIKGHLEMINKMQETVK